MSAVLFTVDTELSPGLHQRGVSASENFRRTVLGEMPDGVWGIGHQMERLSAHGLKGVFFVETLCAGALGIDVLKRVVATVLEAGHEVQLHLHTEWLKWIEQPLVGVRRGTNMWEFDCDDQRRLIEFGLEALQRAGAPRVTAFRAGNYGANNDTLKALASLGLTYDSSYNQPYLGSDCSITTHAMLNAPTALDGVVEVPVTCFEDYPGHVRPLQLCAVSAGELRWVVTQAIEQERPTIVIVSHGFELLNATRDRANKTVVGRLDTLCAFLQHAGAATTTFGALDLAAAVDRELPKLRSSPTRTAARVLGQAWATLRYDRW